MGPHEPLLRNESNEEILRKRKSLSVHIDTATRRVAVLVFSVAAVCCILSVAHFALVDQINRLEKLPCDGGHCGEAVQSAHGFGMLPNARHRRQASVLDETGEQHSTS